MAAVLARWTASSPRARIVAVAFAVCVIAAIGWAALAERDRRVPLFAAALRSEQVAEVVERLAEWNVPFVAVADNVHVDARRRNDILLKLSLAGVPHVHLASSAEALAKAGPLTPQSVLDAQQRDGLAGDLASGLRGLAGIADAQVIIAPARDGAFADETSHDATASVRLALKPGAALGRDVLEGVRQFVAAGVPGLDPRRVAILDDRGLALGTRAASGSDEAAALRESLQSALDLAIGSGATIVRVRVSYDPRLRSVHDVVRRPLGSRPIATTTADERFKSASKTYAKSATSVDRGSETQDERIETPGGRLERISVAVAVDQTRRLDLGKIRSLAAATLGLVPSRGDAVSVEEIAFPHANPAALPAPLATGLGLAATLAPSLVVAAAILLALRIGAPPVARVCEALVARLAIVRTTQAVATFAPSHVRGALANEPPHTAAAIISALPAATATAVLDLYPPEERAAIVRRMSRAAAPVVPDCESVLRRG
ncbi:MAG: hypothetical protein NVSMB19_12470 [Vulcanimicrobiaceae bacterium]